jgi:hypothetical protein
MFHRRSTNIEQVSTTNRLIMAAAANGGGVAGADGTRPRQRSVFGVGGAKIDGNYATVSNAMRRDSHQLQQSNNTNNVATVQQVACRANNNSARLADAS